MSRYTVTIRELASTFSREEVEAWFSSYNLKDVLTQEEIDVINNRGVWSKAQLAKRIVDHYWLREIGFESPGEFIHYAKDRMSELMETYLPLIYSASIKYDPLVNVDFTESFERNASNKGTNKNHSSANSDNLVLESDTPQNQITKADVLSGKYASRTTGGEATSQVNDEGSVNGENHETYTKKTKGNSGVSATAQKMIEQYRTLVRALNTEIVHDLNGLFMGIY